MADANVKDIHDIDPETGRDTERVIVRTKPASAAAVAHLLGQPINEPNGNGRSEWLWMRLANGDLVLGFFPQGDSYFEHELEYDI